MTTTHDIAKWVEAYRSAWISNDPDDIRSLFTDDAVYSFRPRDPQPLHGADAIVTAWMEEQDSPETWKFDFEVLGLLNETTDPVGIVQGVTEYLDDRPTFDNLWMIRLSDDGRASEFTEWYYPRKGTGKEPQGEPAEPEHVI